MVSVSKFHIGLERQGKGSGTHMETHKYYRACSQTVRWNVRSRDKRCCRCRTRAAGHWSAERSLKLSIFVGRTGQTVASCLAIYSITPLLLPPRPPDSRVCSSEQNSTRTVKILIWYVWKTQIWSNVQCRHFILETGLRSRPERGFSYSSGWNINDFLRENEVITEDRCSLL